MRHPDISYCCGPNDCFEVSVYNVRLTRSGYAFTYDGRDFVAPFEKVQRSRDEHSDEFWACFTWMNGEPDVRCFFAPPLGT